VQSFVDMSQEGSDTLSTMQGVEGTVRSGSAPILSDLVLPTQPSNNSLRDVPVSTGSDWSSSGTTPPLPPARREKEHKEKESSPKLTHSRQSSTHSRSSHSKSPQAESSNPDSKESQDDVTLEIGPTSGTSLPDLDKAERVSTFQAQTARKQSSKSGGPSFHPSPSGGYHPSPSSGIPYATNIHPLVHNLHPSTSSFTSVGSGEKKSKRKSWINNALNPTYTSRCEDMRKNFPGLPPDEILLGDYSCALQKDILVHGRIYITSRFLCFYANIFKWETAVTIRWKEVDAMTKEKTALVIPNAIQICTISEKFFFCSFATRDKTHMMLFRVWQNALMDSPASQNELWSLVNSTYGEGSRSRNSDVENDVSNDGASNHSYDGLEVQMRPRLYSNIQEENEENKLPINAGSFLPDRVGDQPMVPTVNKSVDSLPTDQSDTESDMGDRSHRSKSGRRALPLNNAGIRPGIVSTDILTYEVWRQSKNAREILSKNFNFNIDDLFTLLFTNSKFFYDFQAERKTFDIVQCPWQQSQNSDEKFRKVEFTLNLNHAMGPKTSRATEVQTMKANSVPGHIYSVDIETTNADIPYADTFFVVSHICLVRVTDDESRLSVLCDIKYKKNPWGLVKSFLEKNVWAGLEDHYGTLSVALDREVLQRNNEGLKDPGLAKRKTRKQRNRKLSNSEAGQIPTVVPNIRVPNPNNTSLVRGEVLVDVGLNRVLMVLLCFLCLLNVVLLIKIWSLESQVQSKVELFDDYKSDWSEPRTTEDWFMLLHRQELAHNKDLQNWQEAVRAASGLLRQTEATMNSFTKSFVAETNRKLLKHFLQEQEFETASRVSDKTEL